MLGHIRYKRRISDRGGGQNHPKWPKKWCFSTSVTKRVLGSIKRLLEYDIEYYGTPSGNYELVPACPQHTCRGGVKKIFFTTFCRFYAKIEIFLDHVLDHSPLEVAKFVKNFAKIFFSEFSNIFQKKRKFFEILKIFDWPMVHHLCTVLAGEIVEFSENQPFLSTFSKWCNVYWPSGVIIHWKLSFSEIIYISLKKQIFSNFWHSPANLWCIT